MSDIHFTLPLMDLGLTRSVDDPGKMVRKSAIQMAARVILKTEDFENKYPDSGLAKVVKIVLEEVSSGELLDDVDDIIRVSPSWTPSDWLQSYIDHAVIYLVENHEELLNYVRSGNDGGARIRLSLQQY